MIEITHISKKYGEVQALTDVSLHVQKAELFGLIGPDGAGKTSLMRILATLLLPDSGHATVNGTDVVKDYRAVRNSIGYMPGRFSLYQDLSMEENLTSSPPFSAPPSRRITTSSGLFTAVSNLLKSGAPVRFRAV